jgi:hypothetical protein
VKNKLLGEGGFLALAHEFQRFEMVSIGRDWNPMVRFSESGDGVLCYMRVENFVIG